jgi:thioredoxin-like negative regulator of GroEL
MRWRLLLAVLGIAAPLAAWATARAVDSWRYQAALERAKATIASGSPAEARRQLAEASARWPGRGEAEFLLGACEQALGRPEAAEAAWSSVPSESPYAGHAAMLRARLHLRSDQLAEAEELLPSALRSSGRHAIEARESLVSLFKLEGRFAEVRALVQGGWDSYPDRIGLLRELATLDSINPVPVEKIGPALEKAAGNAPDDDRIRLGRANLAIRTGRFEEAGRLLDDCLRRRPKDAAVWKGGLDLAVATGDVLGARRALGHLPPSHVPTEELLALRAWFAARAGDTERERRALEGLLGRVPGHLQALERLAEIELQAGRADRAVQLRARKAEADRAKARYEMLVTRPSPEALHHVVEMARLAEVLGRWFEARSLWSLELERRPGDPEAQAARSRLARSEQPAGDLTPAALLAELGPTSTPADRPGPRSLVPTFTDDAEAVGLRFRFDNGATPSRQMPETMSGGVGLLDYDGDGWLDVYLVQGGKFPPDPQAPPAGDRLFRNRADGTFEDATESAGIAGLARGYGHGVTVGDFDSDGHPDLFLTRWRAYQLLRNRGDGTFEDVTEAAGLGGDRDWPTSAAFADLDNDGDLDLYVCHYLEWDAERPRLCRDEAKPIYRYCAPQHFRSRPDHLFRNDGGRFTDLTAEAGIDDWHGQGLGVVAADFDGDGHLDLFVANDQSANYLFRNRGGLKFEEVGEISGAASNANGGYQASMGVACGDFDEDGLADLAVTNFYNESTTFYRSLGDGIFADHTAEIGLAIPSRHRLGFGAAFLDANDDGHLDLATVNGHVEDYRPEVPYAMPAQLFVGDGRRVADVSDRAGPPWRVPRVGRGLAVGDLDNDGRTDLLLVAQDGPMAYVHNRTAGGHFLTLRLEGMASNRDAVGARVAITAGGRRRVAWRFGGGSYQSASDPRLHFGLGDADRVEAIEVAWPSGRVDRFGPLAADTGYLLREGLSSPAPLAGFGPRPVPR